MSARRIDIDFVSRSCRSTPTPCLARRFAQVRRTTTLASGPVILPAHMQSNPDESSLPHQPTPHEDELLGRHLTSLLGELEPEALGELRANLQWIEVAAGETLMRQGEPGDCMYLSISGRLRAYIRDADADGNGNGNGNGNLTRDSTAPGPERRVREMARGQVIGEMALYTDEPRSATVVAIRDSVLVRLDKAAFNRLLGSSPQVSVAMTRQLIRRLRTVQSHPDMAPPVTIGMLPVSAGVDAAAVAQALAVQLQRVVPDSSGPMASPRVCVVDAARIDAELQLSGLARSPASDSSANRRIALHLDQIEARHDYVLLVADSEPTPWTQRCSRRCDEMLLLADATQPPLLHATETQFLMQRPGRAEATEVLVLLHPADRRCPQGTRAWLARRPVADHVHVRPALEADMARLARIQSRTAVGLVLAGGGARGLAHLGVARALAARGIAIDFVGGTSIGAVMAVLLASGRPLEDAITIARKAFSINPTGDFNPFPLLSLIRGLRLRQVASTAIEALLGGPADVEDLWKNFYCVASNYSQTREQVVSHGSLLRAVLASAAIPGVLPPVLMNGDLLCDGGTFNNFPVDVMRARRGVGKVIGVDLSSRKPRKHELEDLPSTWALLRDKLRPRKKRHYRLPSLVAYLLNVTVLYSASRQHQSRQLTDLHFNPPLDRVGMLQWSRFDDIVAQGQAHAVQRLDALDDKSLQAYRPGNLPSAADLPGPQL